MRPSHRGDLRTPLRRRPLARQTAHRQLIGTLERIIARIGRRIVAFDRASAEKAADLRAQSQREGRPMAAMDAQIAGIARIYGLSLITRNVGDFDGLGIDLVDPWDN